MFFYCSFFSFHLYNVKVHFWGVLNRIKIQTMTKTKKCFIYFSMIERLNDLPIPRDLISQNVVADERLHKDNCLYLPIYLSINPFKVFWIFSNNLNSINNLMDNSWKSRVLWQICLIIYVCAIKNRSLCGCYLSST